MATQRFEVLGGPSKFDLMLCLFDNNIPDRQRTAGFLLDGLGKFVNDFIINGVEREDGSGEKWMLTGVRVVNGRIAGHMRGYYNTQTRRGWLELS